MREAGNWYVVSDGFVKLESIYSTFISRWPERRDAIVLHGGTLHFGLNTSVPSAPSSTAERPVSMGR